MWKQTPTGVVRDILSDDLELSADGVIVAARSRGVKATDKSIRDAVYSIRSELKRARAKAAPTAAQVTAPRKAAAPPAALDLTAILANVALVNAVVGACGGVETARRAAEAVRACGGVDPFLQHLDLVAGIRPPDAAG